MLAKSIYCVFYKACNCTREKVHLDSVQMFNLCLVVSHPFHELEVFYSAL